jgi:glycosyltransferase involved in cell wall biosynthesis
LINVLSLFSDSGFAGDYRVKLPAEAVTQKRLETGVHIESTNQLGVDASRYGDFIKINKVFVPGGINAISFQRPYRSGTADVITWLRYHRPDLAISVDIDDEMNLPEDDSYLRRSIALADVLTCSSEALARRFSYDKHRTFVIRSGVPLSALNTQSVPMSRKRARAGEPKERTIGSALNTPKDLGVIRLGSLLSDVTTFRNIGVLDGLTEALGLSQGQVEASGPLPQNLYRVALGEIDVALVPGSSVTQVLEFAAAGVPVIASDTPEHRELVDQGMPLRLVGRKPGQWTRAIKSMLALDDKELKAIATLHRNNVRQYHTVDRRAFDWAGAFRTAHRIVKEI